MNTMNTEEKKQQEQNEKSENGELLTNEQMEKVTGGYIPPNKDKKVK